MDDKYIFLDEFSEMNKCRCPDIKLNNKLSYKNHFCGLNKKCKNFSWLIEEIPLLNNLFEKQIEFIDECIDGDYDKKYVEKIVHIIVAVNSKIREVKKNVIVTFVLYDFLLRNSRYLIDNVDFTKTILKKMEDFIEKEPTYISLANEYGVNYIKWLDLLKDIVKN